MKGWVVTFAGLGINLALGVLYTWSIFARALTAPAAEGGIHLWTASQANLPYAVAVATFALVMVVAGRLQDRFGPRWVATAGGALVGLGMIVASLSPTQLASPGAVPWRMVLGFGIMSGAGIGLAYSSATPAAVKWFPAGKKGLVTGVVVSGFGIATLFTAPLAGALIKTYGVSESFLFLGVVFFVTVAGLAQLVSDPPHGWVPPGSYASRTTIVAPRAADHEYGWREMVRTRTFYVLWAMYACAAFSGLMVIGTMAKIAAAQVGGHAAAAAGSLLVASLALGNGIGRPLSGYVSDRIGRQHTMLAAFLLQALLMGGLRLANTVPALAAAALLIGATYGASLTLFPATTFDFYGTRNAGVNYGLVFTAWGVGGVFGAETAAWIFDRGAPAVAAGPSYSMPFWIAAGLSVAAAALTFSLRAPAPRRELCPVVGS